MCTALLVWSGSSSTACDTSARWIRASIPSGVVIASAELERGTTTDAEGERIFVEWASALAPRRPWKTSGLALVVPLALTGREDFTVSLPTDDTRHRVVGNRLTPGWFESVRIPFLAGRDFTWDDREGAPQVAIVNDTLSRQLWNGQASVNGCATAAFAGNRRRRSRQQVLDNWRNGIADGLPAIQANLCARHDTARAHDQCRSHGHIDGREMRRLSPNAPVSVKPMSDAVAVSVVSAQVGAASTGIFGLVAMLLSAMGVYGLVSFAVGQRKREFAIRQAVGATAEDIVRLILGTNTRLVSIGLALGLGSAASVPWRSAASSPAWAPSIRGRSSPSSWSSRPRRSSPASDPPGERREFAHSWRCGSVDSHRGTAEVLHLSR